jgi:hypothetical protein
MPRNPPSQFPTTIPTRVPSQTPTRIPTQAPTWPTVVRGPLTCALIVNLLLVVTPVGVLVCLAAASDHVPDADPLAVAYDIADRATLAIPNLPAHPTAQSDSDAGAWSTHLCL